MRVQEIPCRIDLDYGGAPRTPGLHVSRVIRDIAQRIHKLPKDDLEEDGLEWCDFHDLPRVAVNRMAAGRAWEDWYGPQIPGVICRPGEFSKDGLIGTPDGIAFESSPAVHEIKFTWYSSAHEILTRWYWLTQLKAYCEMVGANVGYLWPYFAMGNYRGSGPQPKGWRFEFTDEELRGVWRMIVNHAKRMPEEAREGRRRTVWSSSP